MWYVASVEEVLGAGKLCGKIYHLGVAFGACCGDIYMVAAIMFHKWANILAFRTMLGKGMLLVISSKTETFVPGGAIWFQLK